MRGLTAQTFLSSSETIFEIGGIGGRYAVAKTKLTTPCYRFLIEPDVVVLYAGRVTLRSSEKPFCASFCLRLGNKEGRNDRERSKDREKCQDRKHSDCSAAGLRVIHLILSKKGVRQRDVGDWEIETTNIKLIQHISADKRLNP
jgi:hypothetical protein